MVITDMNRTIHSADEPSPGAPWQRMRQSPLTYLLSATPWRAATYTGVTLILGWLTILVYIAIVLLPFVPAWANLLGKIERQRVRLLGLPEIGDPHRPVDGGFGMRIGVRLGEASTWREVVYTLVLAAVTPVLTLILVLEGVVLGMFALAPMFVVQDMPIELGFWTVESTAEAWMLVPIAIPLLIITLYLWAVVAAATASIAIALLGPRQEELAARVEALESSRGVLVDSFEVERRRIERDLHDGPQQELVGAAMQLGEIAQMNDDPTVRTDVEAVQARVERALSSLRDTVRDIHPQVLEDHGVEAACAELGGPVVVQVSVGDGWTPGRRLSGPVERALYYTASEAVTNAVKHAAASTVTIHLAGADTVTMTVTDDGAGGADVSAGSGLAGLVERAEAVGAALTVDSPTGGPTVLHWCGPSSS